MTKKINLMVPGRKDQRWKSLLAGVAFCLVLGLWAVGKGNDPPSPVYTDGPGTDGVVLPKNPPVQVRTIATQLGWGYDVYVGNKPFIHQPIIPGMPGNVGFRTQQQAQKAGEWVARKVRLHQSPPTLSKEELDRLGLLQ